MAGHACEGETRIKDGGIEENNAGAAWVAWLEREGLSHGHFRAQLCQLGFFVVFLLCLGRLFDYISG
jgi:hypothetical protein